MTPKEKAEELVSDFYAINCKLIKVKTGYDMGDRYNLVMPISKQCALIAVDEILEYIPKFEYGQGEKTTTTEYDYLQEVKQEIKKL